MSDTDNQIAPVSDSTDFAGSLELETEATDTDSTEQIEDKPDSNEALDGDKPAEEAADTTDKPEESPETEAEPEKPADETKGMTRAERAEHYQNLERQTRQEVNHKVDQAYQPQTVDQLKDQYLDAGYDDGTALMLARQDQAEQKAQLAEAKAEITQLNANLQVDAVEAREKFDWMNSKSDGYDKDLHKMAADLFSQGMVVDERTGQVISANMTPMQAAQIIDKARNSGIAKAQIKAQKAAEAQMASVSPSSSTAPIANKSSEDKQADALNDAFNSV